MKVLRLQTKNIKRIEAIDITPDGNTVVISGKNGHGKSSTMDSLAMALGGKKLIPPKPVRIGQEEASIKVDLGKFVVTRHWTNPTTSYLSIDTKDGATFKNPQSILNEIMGDLSFDPAAFSTMEPAKRLGLLKQITNLDFTDLDKEHKEKFQKRTLIKRDLVGLNARLTTEFQSIEIPKVEGTLEDIESEMEKARAHNTRVLNAQSDLQSMRDEYLVGKELVKATERELVTLKEDYETREKHVQESLVLAKERLKDIEAKANANEESSKSKEINLEPFHAKIKDFHAATAAKEKLKAKEALLKKCAETNTEINDLTARLEGIKVTKAKKISEADMPIEGLGFGDGEVTYKDLPFEQISMSEQIRISMAIAIALNPRVRIVMIENGSLLDSDAMEQITAMAKEKDFQVWIEKVADTPDGNSIFIEEGKVKGSKPAK